MPSLFAGRKVVLCHQRAVCSCEWQANYLKSARSGKIVVRQSSDCLVGTWCVPGNGEEKWMVQQRRVDLGSRAPFDPVDAAGERDDWLILVSVPDERRT